MNRGGIVLVALAMGLVSRGQRLDAQHVHASDTNPVVQANSNNDASSRSQLVTLIVKDSTIAYILNALAEKTHKQVLFNNTNPEFSQRLSVRIVNAKASDAFREALKGTKLVAKLAPDGMTVMVRPQADSTTEAKKKSDGVIRGRVIDSATRHGIAGATVTVVGTSLSAVTREDGSFTLTNVPSEISTITIKLLGYRSKTVQYPGDRTSRVPKTITLQQTATALSEVVTTVTGQQKKVEIGNDITTLDVPEIMKQAPITSVTDLLEARVPGITIQRTSGIPGAPSRIRLRGIGGGMLANVPGAPTNDPIVIVDGIRIYAGQSGVEDQQLGGGKYPTQSPIDQIDPNSIKKIEVLRGPSAAAMYGSDAANGVIVITTKKGQAGSVRWNVTASHGVEAMAGTYAAPGFYRFGYPVKGGGVTSDAGMGFCAQIQEKDYLNCHLDSLVRFQALNEARLSTLGRGSNTRLSGTASGGTSTLTYSVTGSMANTLGLTKMPPLYQDLFRQLYDSVPSRRMRRPNTLNERSGQATFVADLTPGLRATFTTSFAHSVQHQSSANAQLATLASMYIDSTNIHPAEFGEYAEQLTTEGTVVRHTLALNVSRWKRLPLTATFGMDRNARGAEKLTPRGVLIWPKKSDGSKGAEVDIRPSPGAFTERHEEIATTTARVNGILFPGARVSVTMGTEVTNSSNAAMAGYSDTLVQGILRPSTWIGGTRSRRNTTTGGWFVEPRLNLNSRFFVNPGFRFDGSGVSGSRGGFRGGLWSLFPKLNFSWIALNREGGAPLWGVISFVRPRFAVGVAGVQPGTEMSVRTLEEAKGGSVINGEAVQNFGVRLRSVGNTQLGPEKAREVEGGVDLQMWETRVTLSVTGFYKIRKNAIQSLPLAPSVGTTLDYYANIGHVRNTGGELSLNAQVLDYPNFGWTVDLSVSQYTNTLTKLFGDQPYIDLGNGTRLIEGYPLFSRWSRPISGWSDPKNGTRLWFGDFVVDSAAVYMGNQAPNFEMPFRTAFTLLRGLVSVNAQFNYKAGLTQNNLGGGKLLGNIYENPTSTYGQQAYALAAACQLGIVSSGGDTRTRPCTDYGFIQRVNTLRWNSLSIGYTVPRTVLTRFPILSLSVAVQGSNLGLWTNYRGKDPDVNGTLIGDATSDSGQLPMPRSWSVQIRIGT